MLGQMDLLEEVRHQRIEDILAASPVFLCRFLGLSDHPLAPMLLTGMDLEAMIEDALEQMPEEKIVFFLSELKEKKPSSFIYL
ncbi:hypothetical protein GJ688_07725 [Heliobacillus mobilis]|uniref:Uncharacterized protein n=1 Tax=Heliobacterium mobile TaxID=28064 RepID=A0A6I3SJ04_HELMO|nr:hypothetical protein [Heliobacterium mobile]MTV48869.1 hypothetical protein [Heliobacterium mobile]